MSNWWKPKEVPGNWACASNKCRWEGPKADLKDLGERVGVVCPKCESEDVFPSDDGGWPDEPETEYEVLDWTTLDDGF